MIQFLSITLFPLLALGFLIFCVRMWTMSFNPELAQGSMFFLLPAVFIFIVAVLMIAANKIGSRRLMQSVLIPSERPQVGKKFSVTILLGPSYLANS